MKTRATLALLSLLTLWHCLPAQANNLSPQLDQANQLVERMPISELMGPLAPVALSPFFGLTCLSGMAMLSDKGVLPANQFISNSEMLQSEVAFAVLLFLTLFTSIPKFSKVSKPFAQLVDQVEAYAGIVAYGGILLATNFAGSGGNEESTTVMVHAGFVTMSGDTLLMIVAAINIFVINTVKFLFEILTFVSPIPAVDALFEVINKAVVAALMFVYSLSPAVAFVLNIIIFLCALCLFRWARRWVKYFREVVLVPALNLVLRRVKKGSMSLDRKRVPAKVRNILPEEGSVVKAFPLCKQGKNAKRSLSYLLVQRDLCILARHQLLKDSTSVTYDTNGYTVELETGLLTNRVTFVDVKSGVRIPVVFNRLYDELLDEIAVVYGVAKPTSAFGSLAAVKSIRQLLRNNERGGLQAEMK